MRYVLVPVPADYVLEVMRWVLFRAPDEDNDARREDEEHLRRLVAEADEPTRRLLLLAAKGTLRNEPLRLRDLADELEDDSAAVRATINRLNDDMPGGHPLIKLRAEVTVGVHGQQGTIAYVEVRPDLAPIIRAAGLSADTS